MWPEDLKTIDDVRRYGEALAKAAREVVKWEIRKLEWIREERAKQEKDQGQAA